MDHGVIIIVVWENRGYGDYLRGDAVSGGQAAVFGGTLEADGAGAAVGGEGGEERRRVPGAHRLRREWGWGIMYPGGNHAVCGDGNKYAEICAQKCGKCGEIRGNARKCDYAGKRGGMRETA